MREPDALIVGAGPAGATAAILLARAGARVTLVDKARFPRDKLCGEFVSPEAVEVLSRTGALPRLARQAGRASEVLFTDQSGRSMRLPIPSPDGVQPLALGITRNEMDVALVELSASAGAEVVEGLEVRQLVTSGGRVAGVSGRRRGSPGEATFHGRFVLAADGRDSTVARLLDPTRFRGRASPRFGVKAHYTQMEGFGGAVELHYFRGGYVGLHEVGGGRVNVCALIDRAVTGDLPKDPERIVREIFFRNPAARARLESARRVSDWHAVGSLFFQAEAPVLSGVLLLGDAAGTIDPFAGEGMSMAFRSAEIAAEELARSLGGTLVDCCSAAADGSAGGDHECPESTGGDLDSPGVNASHASAPSSQIFPHRGDGIENAVCRHYAIRWRREFGRRIAICRSLGRLAIRPSFQGPMISLLGRFPTLGRLVARSTRAGLAPVRTA